MTQQDRGRESPSGLSREYREPTNQNAHTRSLSSILKADDPKRVCPDCGRLVNLFVNPRRCPKCRHEWEDVDA